MSLLLTLGLGGSGTPPTPPSGGDTPYMNLLLPTVSVTLGPLYATEVNAAFLRVDSHDHSDGYGKLVGSNGLNINAPLSFHGNGATNLDFAGFNIDTPTAGLTGQIYMSGEDLYCVDGAGNVIQITAAGAVNVSGLGSWTGLTAPAQAGYSSVTKKFSLQSNTTGPKYGLLACGDILLYPGDPNAGTLPYIRIATPNTGVSTYTLQLPPAVPAGVGTGKLISLNHDGTCSLGPATLPGSISFMRMDSNGVPYADVTNDATTLQLSGAGPYVLRITPGGVTSVQIAAGGVNPDRLARNAATAAGSATVVGPSSSAICSVSLTCSGTRPVQISMRSTTAFIAGFTYNDTVAGVAYVTLRQDGSDVNQARLVSQVASQDVALPANCVACVLPPPAAGAHTWDINLFVNSATGTLTTGTIVLYAQEI